MTAIITTDIGEKAIAFKLVEGTSEEGRWQGSWIAQNISVKDSYIAIFQATNKENEKVETVLIWQVNDEIFTWLERFFQFFGK